MDINLVYILQPKLLFLKRIQCSCLIEHPITPLQSRSTQLCNGVLESKIGQLHCIRFKDRGLAIKIALILWHSNFFCKNECDVVVRFFFPAHHYKAEALGFVTTQSDVKSDNYIVFDFRTEVMIVKKLIRNCISKLLY